MRFAVTALVFFRGTAPEQPWPFETVDCPFAAWRAVANWFLPWQRIESVLAADHDRGSGCPLFGAGLEIVLALGLRAGAYLDLFDAGDETELTAAWG
jgi:hypothetical protein